MFLNWSANIIILISIFYLMLYDLKASSILGLIGAGLMTLAFIIIVIVLLSFNQSTILVVIESVPIILIYSIIGIIYLFMYYSPSVKEKALVKKIILEMGTKFSRTEIKEISEKSKVDITSIIQIVKEMIVNQEIHAIYFNSTKTLAFNQQTNIKEIDNLMAQYKQWEEINIGKMN